MIIAIKETDKIVICHSSAHNTDYDFVGKEYFEKENIPMRFTPDGKLFSFQELSRASDILLYDDNFLNMEINCKNIITEIIPYIKDRFCDNYFHYDLLGLTDDNYWGNSLIICQNEHAYVIDDDYNFYEISDYVCFGNYDDVIQSALDITEGLPAFQRIIKAIDFVGELKKTNYYPLVITDTETKEFKFILKGDKTNERSDSL